jgi:prevent-host-death family protein
MYVSSRKSQMSDFAITAAREQFAELVNRVAYGHERVRIVRRGRGLAAIVPIEDLALIEALEDELDLEAVREALADPTNQTPIPWDQVKAELKL